MRLIRNRRNYGIEGKTMTIIREAIVDGKRYPVTISDENEALLAAEAAGRAIIGIWRPEPPELLEPPELFGPPEILGPSGNSERPPASSLPAPSALSACLYLVADPEDVTEELLERTVRRKQDLPWLITETGRLLIREFAPGDPLEPPSLHDGDGVFSDWEKREAYRRSQYRLCECGLWAVVEKGSGRIAGKAGLTGGELGYHIYPEFRGRGYAGEACEAILAYGFQKMDLQEICLRIREENGPSAALARKLGFSGEEKDGGTLLYRLEKARGEG